MSRTTSGTVNRICKVLMTRLVDMLTFFNRGVPIMMQNIIIL